MADEQITQQWTLSNIPPIGHPDVADFAFQLFDIARAEKERLGKPEDFLSNYALYRGHTSSKQSARKGYRQSSRMMPVNFYFANVERTVSSITARNPTGQVVDIDGVDEEAEQVVSQRLRKWWQDSGQQKKTRQTARTMEIYGITTEKPCWNKDIDQPDILVTDPFAFFPAPGYWDNLQEEAPYVCFVYLDYVAKMEAMFKVEGIASEDAYDLLGTKREDYKPASFGGDQTIGNYATAVTTDNRFGKAGNEKPVQRCLVIEVWVRDNREIEQSMAVPMIEPESGQPMMDETGAPVMVEQKTKVKACPDGIRKITIAKAKTVSRGAGYMVLEDCPNPNINPSLPIELASNTYPWGRLPAYHVNSYRDEISIWGFSAAEQVGDLIRSINLIFQKLVYYVVNVMAPPLIVQKNCGITREMIENVIEKAGRLILMPTTPSARIEFMKIPDLPRTFFNVLDLIVKFYDRIYQIEDADRGVAPSGVIAASAIVALQERNQLVMQNKVSAIDSVVEQRSRWAIGLMQNFGPSGESVEVAGETKPFYGPAYAGRKLSYVVEAGSMTPKTSLQREEQAINLYKLRAIGQQGLLEALQWPDWKNEIERTAESQLDQALNILIQAGLPKESALQLRQFLMLPQGGPGDTEQTGPKPGTPRAEQGKTPQGGK